jgi:hypothetical protein
MLRVSAVQRERLCVGAPPGRHTALMGWRRAYEHVAHIELLPADDGGAPLRCRFISSPSGSMLSVVQLLLLKSVLMGRKGWSGAAAVGLHWVAAALLEHIAGRRTCAQNHMHMPSGGDTMSVLPLLVRD